MNDSIIANSIKYSQAEYGLAQCNSATTRPYEPTEAEIKAMNERQVKQAKREKAIVVIAFAERLVGTLNLSVKDAFDKAEELKEFSDKYFESKL
jgi:hypothetical protein